VQRERLANCKAEANALRVECGRVAEELSIAPSVLAPRAALEAIARTRPQTVKEMMACGPMMRWQAELLAPGIRRVLAQFPTGPTPAPEGVTTGTKRR
jgi:hypothetical protein